MNILNLENISKIYMEKPVLNNVCIGIDDSDKIGVVGANGTGKSTLLKIAAGKVEPDEGRVVMGNGIRISYLPHMQYAPIKKLSGGEKRRLYLLKVVIRIILNETVIWKLRRVIKVRSNQIN